MSDTDKGLQQFDFWQSYQLYNAIISKDVENIIKKKKHVYVVTQGFFRKYSIFVINRFD